MEITVSVFMGLSHSQNSKRENISLCSRCYLFGEEAEKVSHLFLLCKNDAQLWRIFVYLRGIAQLMPNKVTFVLYI